MSKDGYVVDQNGQTICPFWPISDVSDMCKLQI